MLNLALPTLGVPELLIILVVVLILFGPKNLPKLGRMMGRSIREFRDASSKVMDDDEEEDDDVREEIEAKPTAKRAPDAQKTGTGTQ